MLPLNYLTTIRQMEYNPSFAERRSFLERRAEKYKDAAKGEVLLIKGNVQQIGKISIIAGLALLGGYIIYKSFFGGNKDEENTVVTTVNQATVPNNAGGQIVVHHTPTNENSIFAKVKEHITLFLIGIAKQKLLEYLEQYNSSKSEK